MSLKEKIGKKFNFSNLFILDIANNHQGKVEHGLKIINEMGSVVRKYGVRAGIKFQFRDLDTFIHPTHLTDSAHKHISRFLTTRLSIDEYQILLEAVRKEELLAICTPFDEKSIDSVVDMGFDVLKIASCSANDWPLLEKASDSGLPVIFSTGGLLLNDIDNVVNFLDYRETDYAMMHCVSIYPTPNEYLQLNRIEELQKRYPKRVIGWSTHEDPSLTLPVQLAVAKGAKIFERHVGVETEKISLNAYSSTPSQVDSWIAAAGQASKICGYSSPRLNTQLERDSIATLRRGMYAKQTIDSGSTITRDQVYFAMPDNEGQLNSSDWREGIKAVSPINPDEPILFSKTVTNDDAGLLFLKGAICEINTLLREAKVTLAPESELEFSHHKGVSLFRETGAVVIKVINREFCKKIIVQLPGQHHPEHLHKSKEEAFQVLYGELDISVGSKNRTLKEGELILIPRHVPHSFGTEMGCVFEEISTRHFDDDSLYTDKEIVVNGKKARKTVLPLELLISKTK